LGELLLEEGLLDEAALAAAERSARRRGCALVRALVDDGLVGEDALVGTLERRLGLPRADFAPGVLDLDALRAVPVDVVERFALVPLGEVREGAQRVLRVAMADPLDGGALETVEHLTGCPLEVQLCAPSEIARVLERHYRGLVTRQIRPATPPPRVDREEPPAFVEQARTERSGPRTQPQHRLSDEASPEVMVRALLRALYAKQLLSEEDFVRELRTLLKGE
jgi:hypothetical protein